MPLTHLYGPVTAPSGPSSPLALTTHEIQNHSVMASALINPTVLERVDIIIAAFC